MMIWAILLIIALSSLIAPSAAYMRTASNNPAVKTTIRSSILFMAALYDGDEATRGLIAQSEMLLVAPIEAIRMDEVQWIRKELPKGVKTSVVSRQALIKGIDGTPFVQMADGVTGSCFCVFVRGEDADKASSAFSKWARDLSARIAEDIVKNTDLAVPLVSFYMASRVDGHTVRIPVPPSTEDAFFFSDDDDKKLAMAGHAE